MYLPAIMPEIIILITMLTVFVLGMVIREKITLPFLSMAGATIALLMVFDVHDGIFLDGLYVVDQYSKLFKCVFLLNLFLTIFLSVNSKCIDNQRVSEYYTLIILATLGMMMIVSAGDLLVLYLSVELMSLSVYVLAGYQRELQSSNEASMKYFLLGTFASAILLYGIAMVYGAVGTTEIKAIAIHIAKSGFSPKPLLSASLVAIVVAFAFKIAAVPFHMWSPDAYEGAPTQVTSFMSIGPKAAGFAALARVLYEGYGLVHLEWSSVISILAILSMAIGNILALTQTNIKRMLAYSSIAHAGYMLIGIIAGNMQAVAIYMIIYALMNAGAFSIVIALNKGEQISTFVGLSKSNPILAGYMLVFMFSLTGIPPTAGFIGKFQLFMPAVSAGYVGLVIVAVIFSAISAYYYLRIVMLMYMKEPQEIHNTEDIVSLKITTALCAVATVIIGFVPSVLL